MRGEVGADPGVAPGELHFHRRLFQPELERRFAGGEELEFSQNHDFAASRRECVNRRHQKGGDLRVGDDLGRRLTLFRDGHGLQIFYHLKH